MPGPVSDSYDPEFGTGENAARINEAMRAMYERVGQIIGAPPRFILEVVDDTQTDSERVTASLQRREWRMLRFALERAIEST